jgi:hypothetical protein
MIVNCVPLTRVKPPLTVIVSTSLGVAWCPVPETTVIPKVRESVLARVPDAPPIETREYGCHECSLTDPDGYALVCVGDRTLRISAFRN